VEPRSIADPDWRWHSLDARAALEAVAGSPDGLSSEEATSRLQRFGDNTLPETPLPGLGARILAQLNHVLIFVLLGAAVLSAALMHFPDAAAIIAVVTINTVVGLVQEGRAERALDAIKEMLAPEASVLRDGARARVPGAMVAPGDIVLLEAGDRIPADIRLLSVRGLYVDESVLTGEAAPVLKHIAPLPENAPLADCANMAFSGTLATAGIGRGVVVATGRRTELGRISGLVGEVQDIASPLVRRMNAFARVLTAIILTLSAAILLIAVAVRNYPFSEAFMAVIGLAVAAIPEGLPAVMTIILAVGVQRMARRHAIVRRMPAIETLGAVTIICSDKTGTLTRNEMAVVSSIHDLPSSYNLAHAALLASDAEFRADASGRAPVGDPMDVAVLYFAEREGVDAAKTRAEHQRLDAIPFDAAHRYLASLNRWPDGRLVVSVKGAPERLLGMCDSQLTQAGVAPIDREHWLCRVEQPARRGERVLAIATKEVSSVNLDFAHLESGCVLLGVLGFEDPPRPEAIAAVADCHAAGIRVKMITGDHGATARTIASQIGLKNVDVVVTGAELDALDAETFDETARRVDVFARVTPEHKLRLVASLQKAGACVAMTGDGVNDAPALKRADVGLAMGKRGSDAAKQAADIVLADDNFATIERAIRAGRTVYDNLRKVILFELPTNGGEASVLIVAILLGVTLPITPLQVLWVNMVTTIALSLALAFEPPEPGIMRRPPRPQGSPLLSAFLLWRIGFVSALFAVGVFGLFVWARDQGADVAAARTVAVNALVALQIFYLFSTRFLHGVSFTWHGIMGTRAVLICVGLVVLLQLLFTYAPPFQVVFDTRAVTVSQGLAILGAGALLFVIMEIDKAIYHRRRLRRQARKSEAYDQRPA